MTEDVNKILLQLQSTDLSEQGYALNYLRFNPIDDERIIIALVDILCTDNDLNIVEDTTWTITRYGEKATSILLSRLSNDDPDARHNIVHALGKVGDVKAFPHLLDATQDSNASVRLKAVVALGQLGDIRAIDALINCLDDVIDIAWQARDVLEFFGSVALPKLIQCLQSGSVQQRELSASILGSIGDSLGVESLIEAMDTTSEDVQLAIMDALGQIGDQRALPVIEEMTTNDDRRIQAMAKIVLEMLS